MALRESPLSPIECLLLCRRKVGNVDASLLALCLEILQVVTLPPKLLLCYLQAPGPSLMTRCPKAQSEAHLPQFQPAIFPQVLASFVHPLPQFQLILLKLRPHHRKVPRHPRSEPADRRPQYQEPAQQAQHKSGQHHLCPQAQPRVDPILPTLFIDGLWEPQAKKAVSMKAITIQTSHLAQSTKML